MTDRRRRRPLTAVVAGAWLGNGLYAKLLGRVPRHERIVARVLGPAYAAPLTRAIGAGEVALAAWIVGGAHPRTTAALQVGLVATMNALEAARARDLLLWGRTNAAFAAAFCALAWWHGQLGDDLAGAAR